MRFSAFWEFTNDSIKAPKSPDIAKMLFLDTFLNLDCNTRSARQYIAFGCDHLCDMFNSQNINLKYFNISLCEPILIERYFNFPSQLYGPLKIPWLFLASLFVIDCWWDFFTLFRKKNTSQTNRLKINKTLQWVFSYFLCNHKTLLRKLVVKKIHAKGIF